MGRYSGLERLRALRLGCSLPSECLGRYAHHRWIFSRKFGSQASRFSSACARYVPTFEAHVTAADVPSAGPLVKSPVSRSASESAHVATVHSAKDESIPAVIYLIKKSALEDILGGTSRKEGRIS